MPRIHFAIVVCSLSICIAGGLAGGMSAARADEGRGAYGAGAETVGAPPRPQSLPSPASNAPRLHPEACASLCRVFEFLGSLERPAPPKPIPTS